MSLVLALKGADGIVMASDSRATIGDPRGLVTANDTVQKIFKVNDRVIMGVAGEANIGVSIVQEILNDSAITSEQGLKATVTKIREKSLRLLNQWLGQREVIAPQAIINRWPTILFLVAGYDAADTVNAATYLRTQTVDTDKEYLGTSSTSAELVGEEVTE